MRATRALISLKNFRENIRLVWEKTRTAILVPVKANAYGHGALEIAKAALETGLVRACAVATVAEGEELRDGGIEAPILLLSIPLPGEIERLVAADLQPFVGDMEFAGELSRQASLAGKVVPVHLKIDTGMGRIGCSPEEAADMAAFILEEKNLRLAGTATHLAVSDSLTSDDRDWTFSQIESFKSAVERIRAAGIDPGIVHAANTGAVTFYRDSWFDMVRPGILLYGYSPKTADGTPALAVKPVMELQSSIVLLKNLKKGQSVSYGRTWTAPEGTVIGTIPVGYADGLPRLASGKWSVLVGGSLRPLVGRICMDQCMVNLGPESAVSRWDTVTVFGGGAPDAGELAEVIGTIPYEITCNINRRVPRIYEDT